MVGSGGITDVPELDKGVSASAGRSMTASVPVSQGRPNGP